MGTMRLYRLKSYLFLFLIVQCCDAVTPLPKGLVTLNNNKKSSSVTIPENNQTVTFCILVPESFNNQALKGLESFSKNISLEDSLLSKNLGLFRTEPVILFFEWQEAENSQIRKQAGQDLASALNDLKKRFKDSEFILIGIGQGGNVINLASNLISLPIQMVIQLLTPLFPVDNKELYTDYIPNNKVILSLFSFYSNHAFPLAHPTLHPNYIHTYPDKLDLNKTTLLLLIENQHAKPQQDFLLTQDGQKFFTIAAQLTQQYPLHKKSNAKFAVNLSSRKPETDMMIFFIDSVSRENDLQWNQEEDLSNNKKKEFEKSWGRPLQLTLNNGEKSRVLNKSIGKAATKS